MMEKKEPPLIIENNGQTETGSEAISAGNGANDNTPAKKDVKTKGRKTKSNKTPKSGEKSLDSEAQNKKGLESQVIIAIITAIATIITTIVVTLPSILPLVPWLQPSPSPTPTFTPTATITAIITDTATATQTLTFTPISSPSPTVTETRTAIVTSTLTETPTIIRVFVKLEANRTTGRPPLNVRFDARNSYLLEPDGRQLSCRGGPCFYTWKVYFDSQQIGRSENNSSGTFEYTFGSNGIYTVTVWVCRGQDRIDCAGSGTQIEVSRSQ